MGEVIKNHTVSIFKRKFDLYLKFNKAFIYLLDFSPEAIIVVTYISVYQRCSS